MTYDGFEKIQGPFRVSGSIKSGIASSMVFEGRDFIVIAKTEEALQHLWLKLDADSVPLDPGKFLHLSTAPSYAFEKCD